MVKYFSRIELANLFSKIDSTEKKLLFQTTLELGCRVGELLTISRSRIKGNYIRVFDEKKDKYRDCYISQKLAGEIDLFYWNNQSKVKPGKRMLCYYSAKTLNNWLKEYGRKANIPEDKLHMHTFRHTFIVFAWDNNWNPKSICDQTGDSLETLVKVYSGLSPEGRQEQWIKKPLFLTVYHPELANMSLSELGKLIQDNEEDTIPRSCLKKSKCPKCNNDNPYNVEHCSHCGTKLPSIIVVPK